MSGPTVEEVLVQFQAVFNQIAVDHEARIRALEKKHTVVNAIVSGVVSLTVAIVAALAGCALPEPAEPTTPSQANDATVYMEAYPIVEPGSVEEAMCQMFGCGWSGTGWFVNADTVVTAGHVCDKGAVMLAQDKSTKALVMRGLEVVYDDDEVDVCVLKVIEPDEFGPHTYLRLAPDSEMSVGDTVWYWGYPGGEPAVFYGHYTGRLEGDYVQPPRIQVAVPGWFGASGSAMLDVDGRVVGVLVETYVGNGIVLRATPVEEVYKALAASKVI